MRPERELVLLLRNVADCVEHDMSMDAIVGELRSIVQRAESLRCKDAAAHIATDAECICRGNWRLIVKETEPYLGRRYRDHHGDDYTLMGIVHGEDDYYYMMYDRNNGLRLLTCVGSIENQGFSLLSASISERDTDSKTEASAI